MVETGLICRIAEATMFRWCFGPTKWRLGVVTLAAMVFLLVGTAGAQVPVTVGACGELDTELTDASPHLLSSVAQVYPCSFQPDRLSPGGLDILLTYSSGGSGVYALVLAHELLFGCEGATLVKTMDEINYVDPGGHKAQALLEIDGTRIGLRTTRAIGFPLEDPLTVSAARQLLEQQLQRVIYSTANVAPEDAWQKQILVVETPLAESFTNLAEAYAQIGPELTTDTIVWLVQTANDWAFIYSGADPVCLSADVDGQAATFLDRLRCSPNPFNPRTTIKFSLPRAGTVRLSVFDVAGRLVRTLIDGGMPLGGHEAVWDGRDASGREVGPGSYLARLEFGGRVETVRMGLIR